MDSHHPETIGEVMTMTETPIDEAMRIEECEFGHKIGNKCVGHFEWLLHTFGKEHVEQMVRNQHYAGKFD